MNITQHAKARSFRALHDAPEIFVMPNAWDAGSARLLAGLGFPALATSSFACAVALGRRDHQVTRDETLAHARLIVDATDLPVSADLESGLGERPEDVAETIALAAEAGLVGGSIEDSSSNATHPIRSFDQAVERVRAAVEAARRLDFPFVLTARAENFLHGVPDLDDTIRRLRAYEEAGADVLFAPGLPDLEAVKAVCKALTKPVSFMCGLRGKSFPLAELAAAGVRRVSTGPSLHRAAMGALLAAAREIKENGTFGYIEALPTGPELYRLIGR